MTEEKCLHIISQSHFDLCFALKDNKEEMENVYIRFYKICRCKRQDTRFI